MSAPPYDEAARRDTPLAGKLAARIRRDGPIDVAGYMRACLYDEEHGYYVGQQAIGREGDFVTAPEISQVFGELIGLWCAVVWQQMGAPAHVHLVELGPGRGTLLKDALRAARLVPPFCRALCVHLVECNRALIAAQHHALAGLDVPLHWHAGLEDVPEGPAIVLGNEFLDTFPIAQFVACEAGNGLQWRARTVALDGDGRLAFAVGAPLAAEDARAMNLPPPRAPGDLAEHAFGYAALDGLAMRAARAPLAALLVDYGSEGACRDTLQAVRRHRYEHPLTSPGEADLTAHVRFDELASRFGRPGSPLAVDGPVPQAAFLGRLGIVERASKLMAANPAKSAAIQAGIARLMAAPGMGDRFKAIGLRSRALPPLPGLHESR